MVNRIHCKMFKWMAHIFFILEIINEYVDQTSLVACLILVLFVQLENSMELVFLSFSIQHRITTVRCRRIHQYTRKLKTCLNHETHFPTHNWILSLMVQPILSIFDCLLSVHLDSFSKDMNKYKRPVSLNP